MKPNLRCKNIALGFLLTVSAVLTAQPESQNDIPILKVATPDILEQRQLFLNELEREQFARGRGLFNQVWMAAPSLDKEHDGLGPTYNQPSCSACHLRNGRGQSPASERERMRGALVRLSISDPDVAHGTLSHPAYGEQFNDAAITGIPAEGRVVISWLEHTENFADGEVISLRRPVISFTNLAFGPAGDDLLTSLRVAPQIVGAGYLDAVTDETIESFASISRPDGISGRVNRVIDKTSGVSAIGRFGWKANASSLHQQTAAAFSGDLGITSHDFPAENCPQPQTLCSELPVAAVDLSDMQLRDVVFYQAALKLPLPRDETDPKVLRGKELFSLAGCEHCHIPALTTSDRVLVPVLVNTTFHAYTDLLLHDMGEALADGRPDHDAGPAEWKTAPLWSLGLLPIVNEHQTLLHDGRARGVLEAIMWHGGEAEQARVRVKAFSRADRDSLVAFVNSL